MRGAGRGGVACFQNAFTDVVSVFVFFFFCFSFLLQFLTSSLKMFDNFSFL